MNHADGLVTRGEIGNAPECTIEEGRRYNIDMLQQKAGLPSVG